MRTHTMIVVVFLAVSCGLEKTQTPHTEPVNAIPQQELIFVELALPEAPAVKPLEPRTEPPATYGGFFTVPGNEGLCATRLLISTTEGSRVYRLEAGALVLDTSIALPRESMPVALYDLNGDGILDAVTALEYGRTVIWSGTPEGEFDHRFHMTTQGGAPPYPYDIDGDGRLDLVVASGWRCEKPLRIFYQTPSGEFEEDIEAVVGETSCNTGYALWVGPMGNERLVVAAFGGSDGRNHNPALFCPRGETSSGKPRFEPCQWEPRIKDGHDSYKGIKVPFFGDLSAKPLVIDFADEAPNHFMNWHAPMGVALGDINGDGEQDFVVATDPILITMLSEGSAWSDITGQVGVPLVDAQQVGSPLPWGIALVDIDGDGDLDLLVGNGKDGGQWLEVEAMDIGPQSISAYIFENGKFHDRSLAIGFGQLGQWKSIALGDLNCDGQPDVAVGGQGELPRVFLNQSRRKGVSLLLKGTVSNPLAMGAEVIVEVERLPRQTILVGNYGGSIGFSEPIVFAGLGASTKAERITIHWPSGVSQTLTNVPAGFHIILEQDEIAP